MEGAKLHPVTWKWNRRSWDGTRWGKWWVKSREKVTTNWERRWQPLCKSMGVSWRQFGVTCKNSYRRQQGWWNKNENKQRWLRIQKYQQIHPSRLNSSASDIPPSEPMGSKWLPDLIQYCNCRHRNPSSAVRYGLHNRAWMDCFFFAVDLPAGIRLTRSDEAKLEACFGHTFSSKAEADKHMALLVVLSVPGSADDHASTVQEYFQLFGSLDHPQAFWSNVHT